MLTIFVDANGCTVFPISDPMMSHTAFHADYVHIFQRCTYTWHFCDKHCHTMYSMLDMVYGVFVLCMMPPCIMEWNVCIIALDLL